MTQLQDNGPLFLNHVQCTRTRAVQQPLQNLLPKHFSKGASVPSCTATEGVVVALPRFLDTGILPESVAANPREHMSAGHDLASRQRARTLDPSKTISTGPNFRRSPEYRRQDSGANHAYIDTRYCCGLLALLIFLRVSSGYPRAGPSRSLRKRVRIAIYLSLPSQPGHHEKNT